MRRYSTERGAALIMLIGMTAALAMLAATLVFVIANESKATAVTRARTLSFYGGEAALDSAVQRIKIASPMPTASGQPWLTQADLAAAFNNQFPPGSTVEYKLYDNLSSIDFASLVGYDSNGDRRMWVDATATAPDSRATKTRERVLIQQVTMPFAAALPKAVTYSDTGIYMGGSSDIYAVNADGTPITDGSMATYISAGGTWTPSMSGSWAEVGRLTVNTNANMAGPGASKQTLGIKVNGSVRLGTSGTIYTSAPNHKVPNTSNPKFTNVFIGAGTVGFLSDYFDQAAQASLVDEAQEGGTPDTAPTAPTAPASWTSTGYTSINSSLLSTITGASYTNTSQDLYLPKSVNSGNMTISTSSARTYQFRNLYVAGDLSVGGPVNFNVTGRLYVGGELTITGSTSATTTDTIGDAIYIAGTSASAVSGRVNLSAASLYCGGAFTRSNSTTTSVTDTIPQIYCIGNYSLSGPVTLNASSSLYGAGSVSLSGPSSGSVTHTLGQIYSVGDFSASGLLNINPSTTPNSLYGGGNVTLTGPTSGTTTDRFTLIYMPTNSSAKTLTFSRNVNVKTSALTIYADFTISGATTAVKDWLGHVYVYAKSSSSTPSLNRGTIDWSGTASVTSRDYVAYDANPSAPEAAPKPMWMGRYFERNGTYNDEYGNIWVPGNSTTSVVFNSSAASTISCPLLATTELTQVGGNITFGSRASPMVFFYVCDNNGIYPQVIRWTNTGTYYGLMVINESTIDFSGDTNATTPTVEGAVFAGCPYDPTHTSGMSMSDIVLDDSCSIAYNLAVVGNISTSSLKTTTTVTQTVPGSWQQLPVD